MDHRHDGAARAPAVEMWGANDPGKGVHDDHVEIQGVEEVSWPGSRPFLLFRGGSARYNLFHLHAHPPQPGKYLRVIEISTGPAFHVSNSDEGYAQRPSVE